MQKKVDVAYAEDRIGRYIEYERLHFDKAKKVSKLKSSGMAVQSVLRVFGGLLKVWPWLLLADHSDLTVVAGIWVDPTRFCRSGTR